MGPLSLIRLAVPGSNVAISRPSFLRPDECTLRLINHRQTTSPC